ncbi:cell division protein FtsQ/DivIB [Nesterenkonia sp. PF2B19]|uniref:cell division protein FtsQ/DivIB n=1 Tax=Nesterenkonia sp. PF2B19 TaxID=1881858 RepID=UPI0008725742|nr:FtsQ-type POTRA domain-containing protein [Nesterenkonia sp. PF2B19]
MDGDAGAEPPQDDVFQEAPAQETASRVAESGPAGAGPTEGDVVVPLETEMPRRSRRTAEEVFEDPGDAPPQRSSSRPVAGPPSESQDWHLDEDDDAEPLPFPEPEVVSTRRRRRRRLGWTIGLVGVLVAVVGVLYFSPLLTIHHIQVERNDLLTESRAQELLQPLYGRPLPQVGNAQVQELLAEEPVVDDVVVQGELPDTLTVEIIEHPPVAEVLDGDELQFYNEHGEVISTFADPEDPEADDHATPRISEEAALRDDAVFSTIVAVLGELPASAREAMDSATADSIDSVQLILDDGRTVVWGGAERGAEKAVVLEAILASEAEDFTEVDTIDISTPDTPVTR